MHILKFLFAMPFWLLGRLAGYIWGALLDGFQLGVSDFREEFAPESNKGNASRTT